MNNTITENLENKDNEQIQSENATQELTLGQKMKATREKEGYSLGDIAERLKLTAKQVEALENNDFDSLPGVVFIRGFYRSYAKILKLSDSQITEDLNKFLPTKDQVYLQKQSNTENNEAFAPLKQHEDATSGGGMKWLITSLILLVICIGAYYVFSPKNSEQEVTNTDMPTEISSDNNQVITPNFSSDVQNTSSEASATAAPSIASGVDNENAPISKNLVVVSGYKTYLTVTDSKGTIWNNSGKTVAAHSAHEFPAENAPYTIRIGFAKNSKVSFDGKEIEIDSKIKNKTLEITIPENKAANNE